MGSDLSALNSTGKDCCYFDNAQHERSPSTVHSHWNYGDYFVLYRLPYHIFLNFFIIFMCNMKVGGRLRCIGSPQHLKSRFGNHLELEVGQITFIELAVFLVNYFCL